jgi:putative transposase
LRSEVLAKERRRWCVYHVEKFITVRAAKDAVMQWILWCNQKRMHSTIGYQSPVEFEQAWQLLREAA